MEDVAKCNRGKCYTLTKRQKEDDVSNSSSEPVRLNSDCTMAATLAILGKMNIAEGTIDLFFLFS
jgi:hypothetical protein